jgi:carboxyl-terminal processing protease
MRALVVSLLVGVQTALCAPPAWAESPEGTLQEQSAQAQALYDNHAYRAAAAVLEKLSRDRQITALPDWTGQLYNLACYQARAGELKAALATLQQLVDVGTYVTPQHMREDPDLAGVRNDPGFQRLLARTTLEAARWADDPALATPYTPVLTNDEKVAGLSKFWSEARFNFPFFSRLPDLDWDRLYMEYLPQVRAAQTTAEYYSALIRFGAALRDGHTNVFAPKELYPYFYAVPAIRTRLVGGKVLITEITDPALRKQGITVGMEITTVDGQPVREYAQQHVDPYVSASTPQDRDVRDYDYQLLAGPESQPVNLVVQGEEPGTTSAVLVRKPFDYKAFVGTPAEFKMLPGNIAYLALNEFEDDLGVKAMQKHFAAISQSAGLILDVRRNGGGNVANGFAILSMLSNKQLFKTPAWRTLDYKAYYRAIGITPAWLSGGAEDIPPDPAHRFLKPVVVLTSPRTFSAAEDFVAAFDATHRGTLVGEVTAGSTGQPLMFNLPGGGSARIGTTNHSYPDGKVFEGVGIVPQVAVTPTVADIRHGRDAVLERATELLRARRTSCSCN